MIKIENVTKKFGDAVVLNDITVGFERGKTYGIIGRNGSGKTMLMKCICGLVIPTSGKIVVNGKELGKEIDIPDNLGVIIDRPGFLEGYSAFQNLHFLSMIKGSIDKTEIKKFIKLVGLDPDNKKAVGKYSLGMKQRLGLAQALMEDPDIFLLDEPMNGLDNDGVDEIRSLILQLKNKHKTIIIASHMQEDIKLLCDEVYKMDKGNIEKTL